MYGDDYELDALIDELEAEGASGRIYRDDATGEIVSDVGNAGAAYVQPHKITLRATLARRRDRGPRIAMPRPRAVSRPRERRSAGRRHLTRGSPDDPDPEHAPGGDTAVNLAWQAALEHLTADWQLREIARLCLLRSRWLRRWRP